MIYLFSTWKFFFLIHRMAQYYLYFHVRKIFLMLSKSPKLFVVIIMKVYIIFRCCQVSNIENIGHIYFITNSKFRYMVPEFTFTKLMLELSCLSIYIGICCHDYPLYNIRNQINYQHNQLSSLGSQLHEKKINAKA